MRRLLARFWIMLSLPFLLFTAAPSQARAHEGDVPSVNVFFEPLASHGDWFYTAEYGWVWTPTAVGPRWQPYHDGHWVYTDEYGWMWASDEPFGWAVYHYGRWTVLGGVWVWVPDVMWGPAWVAWRHTDVHVGWAPLPPGVSVTYYTGVVNLSVNVAWNHWIFVPGAYILSPTIYHYYLPPPQVQVVYYRAVPAARYRVYHSGVYCVGVGPTYVTTWIGGPVPVSRVVAVGAPHGVAVSGGSVYVYRTPPPPSATWRGAPPPARRAAPAGMRSWTAPPPAAVSHRQPAGPSKAWQAPAPSSTQRTPSPQANNQGGYQPPPPSASGSRGSSGAKGSSGAAAPPPPAAHKAAASDERRVEAAELRKPAPAHSRGVTPASAPARRPVQR